MQLCLRSNKLKILSLSRKCRWGRIGACRSHSPALRGGYANIADLGGALDASGETALKPKVQFAGRDVPHANQGSSWSRMPGVEWARCTKRLGDPVVGYRLGSARRPIRASRAAGRCNRGELAQSGCSVKQQSIEASEYELTRASHVVEISSHPAQAVAAGQGPRCVGHMNSSAAKRIAL